jgi:hypothetical protein
VLDDEPGSAEAQSVCAKLRDPRIIYRPNQANLGVGANIDAAFSRPALRGATHACVLEDDNYYLPDFLAANLALMTKHQVDIVLRNQLIELPNAQNEGEKVGLRTTYDNQYVDGIATREELWSTFFFSTAANNSSLFWRLGCGLCFSTGKLTDDPVFQERLRTLRIDRPVCIAMEPKVVWRDNGPESTRPRASGVFWFLAQVRAACREQELYCRLYEHLSEKDATHIIWSSRFRNIDADCERVFRRVGIDPPLPSHLSATDRAILSAKRELARMVGLLVAEPVRYRIGNLRVEEG